MDENTIEYWKKKYEELSGEYDDFTKSSRDLEQMLETELQQKEKTITELQRYNHRITVDNDALKARLSEVSASTQRQIASLQDELNAAKTAKEQLGKCVRELEQKNDNLEQTNRCAMFSLGEFETKLNEALERNAILESELDEKDELAETVQRLRDEARDLKQELAVRQHRSDSLVTAINGNSVVNAGEALCHSGTSHGVHSMDTDFASLVTATSTSDSSQFTSLTSTDSLTETVKLRNTTNNNNNNDEKHENNNNAITINNNNNSATTTTTATTNHPTMLNTILNDLNLKQLQNQKLNGGGGESLVHNHAKLVTSKSTTNGLANGGTRDPNLSPSTRITALNYLHDALRKVTVSNIIFALVKYLV
jgi:DNA repair exonuclease SbcCD ATPase subunit